MNTIETPNGTFLAAQKQNVQRSNDTGALPLVHQSRRLEALERPAELLSFPTSERERQAAELWQKQPASKDRQRSASKPPPKSRESGVTGDETGLLKTGENSIAREAYIRRYQGSPVNAVFAPGEYNIPE